MTEHGALNVLGLIAQRLRQKDERTADAKRQRLLECRGRSGCAASVPSDDCRSTCMTAAGRQQRRASKRTQPDQPACEPQKPQQDAMRR